MEEYKEWFTYMELSLSSFSGPNDHPDKRLTIPAKDDSGGNQSEETP
jgi:hypothetical protein